MEVLFHKKPGASCASNVGMRLGEGRTGAEVPGRNTRDSGVPRDCEEETVPPSCWGSTEAFAGVPSGRGAAECRNTGIGM